MVPVLRATEPLSVLKYIFEGAEPSIMQVKEFFMSLAPMKVESTSIIAMEERLRWPETVPSYSVDAPRAAPRPLMNIFFPYVALRLSMLAATESLLSFSEGDMLTFVLPR